MFKLVFYIYSNFFIPFQIEKIMRILKISVYDNLTQYLGFQFHFYILFNERNIAVLVIMDKCSET